MDFFIFINTEFDMGGKRCTAFAGDTALTDFFEDRFVSSRLPVEGDRQKIILVSIIVFNDDGFSFFIVLIWPIDNIDDFARNRCMDFRRYKGICFSDHLPLLDVLTNGNRRFDRGTNMLCQRDKDHRG